MEAKLKLPKGGRLYMIFSEKKRRKTLEKTSLESASSVICEQHHFYNIPPC